MAVSVNRSFVASFHSNLWLLSSIALAWLLFWAFQSAICAFTVRLAELMLLYGTGVGATDDGISVILATRQIQFASACAGLAMLLALFTAGGYFIGRRTVQWMKCAMGLVALFAAIIVQAIHLFFL